MVSNIIAIHCEISFILEKQRAAVFGSYLKIKHGGFGRLASVFGLIYRTIVFETFLYTTSP